MRNSLSKNIILAIFVAVGFVSCTDEELIDKNIGNALGFQIETGSEWLSGEESVSRGIISEEPMPISDKSGAQVLYLHRYSENNNAIDNETPETRGIPVTDVEKLSSIHKGMSVSAYVGGKLLFANERVPVNASGYGSLANRFWPAKETVDFFALSPYTVEGLSGLSYSGKTAKFSYSIPKISDGKDAEKQTDILFAQASSTKAMSNKGNVSLRFNHALSAIRFVTRDIAGGTIQKITLKNIYGSGSCFYNPTVANKFAWTISGSANNNYSQIFNVSVNDQIAGEQQVTDKNKSTTFMMIPQKLDAKAQIEIVLATKNGGTHTLIGTIGGAIWEAGRIYTYTISTTSINWTYVLEARSQTAPFKATSHQYDVVSYRYRTNNPGVKEDVAWTAAFSAGKPAWLKGFTFQNGGSQTPRSFGIQMEEQEVYAPNEGNNFLKAQAVVGSDGNRRDLSMYDVSGVHMGSRSTANCYVVRAPGYYRFPLVPGNAIKNSSPNPDAFIYKGSKYDWENTKVEPHVWECHEWAFDMTGGRFLLGVRINEQAQGIADNPYLNSQFPGNDLKDAILLWQDAYGVIEDVRLSADKQFVEFNVDPQKKNIQQSNAVLALRHANGQIIWSWHIWVTNVDLNKNQIAIDDYENAAKKYNIGSCELGWCEANPHNNFPSRNENIVFTQTDSNGKSVTMTFTQEGKDLQKTKFPNVTYYQFGRKDPMLAVVDHSNEWKSQYYTAGHAFACADNSYLRVNNGKTVAPYVEDGSGFPHIMFAMGDLLVNRKNLTYMDTYNESVTCLWNNSPTEKRISLFEYIPDPSPDKNKDGMYEKDIKEQVVKTVYDPCPVGFSLPPKQAFRVFVEQGASNYYMEGKLNGRALPDYKWELYPSQNKGGAPFIVEGFGGRAYKKALSSGGVGGIYNRYFLYWMTADNLTSDEQASSVLAIGRGEYCSMAVSARAIAKPVRPMKEM